VDSTVQANYNGKMSNKVAKIAETSLSNWTPWHGNHDATLHLLDQRYRLVNSISPSWNLPTALTAELALLQVGKLPEMMDNVQISYLNEPSANTFHDFSTSLESLAPMRLPLEKIARVQSVRAKLKETSQLTW
jgi:hypothetical protein